MLDGKIALLLFYSVFWATSIASVARYRLFETNKFFGKKEERLMAWRRFVIGFLIIDILPVIWVWILYDCVVPNKTGVIPIIIAAFSAISFFGFPRILHSIVATNDFHKCFYDDKDWEGVMEKWGGGDPNTLLAHLLPGIGFIIFLPLIGILIGKIVY